MKVSDCCGVGPDNDYGLCPRCRDHCEFVEEDDEDDEIPPISRADLDHELRMAELQR